MISKNLKKLRSEKKISLRALSEKADVSKSTLSDIENDNVKSTTINTLEKIADALEVSVGYLIGESVDYIIEQQLEKLNLTYDELAQQTGIDVYNLKDLSNIIPGPQDYKHVQMIAKTLNIKPESLITALAKQEPPLYEGSYRSTPEEDFLEPDALSDEEIFTLAAQVIGYDTELTEKDIEKMKLALKVALNS